MIGIEGSDLNQGGNFYYLKATDEEKLKYEKSVDHIHFVENTVCIKTN